MDLSGSGEMTESVGLGSHVAVGLNISRLLSGFRTDTDSNHALM